MRHALESPRSSAQPSQALQVTTMQQKRARRYEDAANGKSRLREPAANLSAQLQKAERRHAEATAVAEDLAMARPELAGSLRQLVADVQPLAAAV